MENVTEALIMAGQVLIFIVALTICMTSFSNLRVGVDNVINHTEVIEYAKDRNSDSYINLIKSRDEGATRIVSAETVVASMYRAIKENFSLYIKLKDTTYSSVKLELGNIIDVDENHRYEIKYNDDEKCLKITIANDGNFIPDTLLRNGLYKIIRESNFYEYIGEYQDNTDASTENKLTKRIITYVQK